MEKNFENPPAFARPSTDYNSSQEGMELRDYFAAAALPQIIEATGANGYEIRENINGAADSMAQTCYSIADAMLKARAV